MGRKLLTESIFFDIFGASLSRMGYEIEISAMLQESRKGKQRFEIGYNDSSRRPRNLITARMNKGAAICINL